MPKRLLVLTLPTTLAVLLAATAACSAPSPVSATSLSSVSAPAKPATPPQSAQSAQPIEVLSASFVSPSTGWLLAEPQCAYQANPCRATVLMRKTVDGGRTWFAVPAPSAPPANPVQSSPPRTAVGQVLFTSSRDGWAAGPSLWRTTDGGATWRRVPVPGPVADFTVSGDRMLAVAGGCPNTGNCTLRGYAATIGEDNWRPIPGTALTGFATAPLAVSGQTGYMFANSQGAAKPALLAGPVTGSARWRRLPEPCTANWSGAIAAAGGWLFLGCGAEPGAGNQLKTAYVSQDGGYTWRQVASPPFGGYLGSATMSAGGTIFLSGERMDVYISRDRGHSWHESPSLASGAAGLANAGFPLLATTVTDSFGVAVQEGVPAQQVWFTSDGGRHWRPATVR